MPHIGNFPPVGYPKPLIVGALEFLPGDDTYDFVTSEYMIRARTSLTPQYFFGPVLLPHGATVTKLTLYGARTDELAAMTLYLRRLGLLIMADDSMATVIADWIGMQGSGFDDTIDYAVIDNDTYYYGLQLVLDPNALVTDVIFAAARIDWK